MHKNHCAPAIHCAEVVYFIEASAVILATAPVQLYLSKKETKETKHGVMCQTITLGKTADNDPLPLARE